MVAKHIMSAPLITVRDTAPVSDIANIIINQRISAVPVVDASGKLVGLVSASDLLEREDIDTAPARNWLRQKLWPNLAAKEFNKAHGSRAEHVMTRDLVTVSQEAALTDVIAKMVKRGIQRVIVVNDEEPVGILSRRDVLRAILAQQEPSRQSVRDEDISRDLLTKLERQPWFSKARVQVRVRDGVVTLYGVVHSRDERAALILAAEKCPGVAEVIDRTVSEFM